MAIKRYERYPSRYLDATDEQPQGAFKDRTSPNANDGSYLQADWLNDFSGFFSAALTTAGMEANGLIDNAVNSQYLDAVLKSCGKRKWTAVVKKGAASVIAEAFSENQYFSGILRLTLKQENDASVTAVILVSSVFSDDPAVTLDRSLRTTAILLSGYVPESLQPCYFRVVRYENNKDSIEINFDSSSLQSDLNVECEIVMLSGDVTELTEATQPLAPSGADDSRISVYIPIARNPSINGNTIYTSKNIPSASIANKGIVRLSDDYTSSSTDTAPTSKTLADFASSTFNVTRYVDVTATRAINVGYVNRYNYEIIVSVKTDSATGTRREAYITVNGMVVAGDYAPASSGVASRAYAQAVIPPLATYSVYTNGSVLEYWVESNPNSTYRAGDADLPVENQLFYADENGAWYAITDGVAKDLPDNFLHKNITYDEFLSLNPTKEEE